MNVILKSMLFPLFWTGAGAVTIGTNVYVLEGYWKSLTLEFQNAILAHEAVHVRQETQIGLTKFLFRYIFSRKFRFFSELEAYAEEARYWIRLGIPKQFMITISAVALSSNLYRASSYSKAVAYLTEALNDQTDRI